MHPVILRLGSFVVYSYGLMLALALLVTTWLACRVARRGAVQDVPMSVDQIMDFSCLSLLGGIFGARLLFVILQWEFYARSPEQVPAIWRGGLVWYGGFLGSLAVGWGYTRAKRIAFLRMTDQFIPFLALGHAIGRLGCFLNGCCYGRPTERWCGVLFPGHAEAVLPTQLFEATGLFLLYLVLRRLQRPVVLRRHGLIFGSYLVLYGILRFGIEFLRGDQPVWWAGLTLQQLVSFVGIAAGLVVGMRASKVRGAR